MNTLKTWLRTLTTPSLNSLLIHGFCFGGITVGSIARGAVWYLNGSVPSTIELIAVILAPLTTGYMAIRVSRSIRDAQLAKEIAIKLQAKLDALTPEEAAGLNTATKDQIDPRFPGGPVPGK